METFPQSFCLRPLLLAGGEMFESCLACLQTVIICTNIGRSVQNYSINVQYFPLAELRCVDLTVFKRERQIWPGLNLDSEMYWLNSFNAGEEFLNQYNLELSLFSDQLLLSPLLRTFDQSSRSISFPHSENQMERSNIVPFKIQTY